MRILMILWRCDHNEVPQLSLTQTMVDCFTPMYSSPTPDLVAITLGHVTCLGHT